jgi:hypothetical protein
MSKSITKYQDELEIYERILNKILKKEYWWFRKIEIEYLSFNSIMDYIGIEGTIYVDIEWGANQWREYHYDAYFKANDDFETEPISFGDIIGGEESIKIQEIFADVFTAITGNAHRELNISWSWLKTYFLEEGETISPIEEQTLIRKILSSLNN